MAPKKRVKGTVPVLAYAEGSGLNPPWLLCSLSCKFSSDYNAISLLVNVSVPSTGSNEEQHFVLVYDAEDLATALVPDAGACDPAWVDEIARKGVTKMHTLSLALSKVCSVWYPPGQFQTSLLSHPTNCPQLVEIAKAKKVCLKFDFSWLQGPYKSCINRLAKNATGLAGFPVAKTLRNKFKQGDWTIFHPLEASIQPPAYTKSETFSSPPAKHALLETQPETFVAGSPTEVATYPSCDDTSIGEIYRLTSDATGLAGNSFEQGHRTIPQPVEASIEPPAYTKTSHKRAKSETFSSPPAKRALLETQQETFVAGSPTEVATYPSCDDTSIGEIYRLTSDATGLAGNSFEQGHRTIPQSIEASIEPPAYTDLETSHKLSSSPTEVATSPSCDDTSIGEPSPKSFLAEPNEALQPQSPYRHQAAPPISKAYDFEAYAFEAFASRCVAHPSISPSPSHTSSQRTSSSPPPVRLPPPPFTAMFISYILSHIEPRIKDIYVQQDDNGFRRREREEQKLRERVHDCEQEAIYNIEIYKEEVIESLNELCDEVVRLFKDELVAKTHDFEESIDCKYWVAVSKLEDGCEKILEDRVKKMAAISSATPLKLDRKAAALSLNITAKARRDIVVCGLRRHSFRRGKGGYRGLGERCLRM